MVEQDVYPGTPTPEWDEVRRLTQAWLDERWPKDQTERSARRP